MGLHSRKTQHSRSGIDDEAASANIERLADYTIDDIRITHGPNVSDGTAAIEQLLEDFEAHE